MLNPAKGFFATANQNVTPSDYEHWDAIGYTWADPFRGDRINQVLTPNNKVTLEDMGHLQTDYISIPASKLLPLSKSIVLKDAFSKLAFEKLINWDYVLDKSSIPAGIYAMWEKEIAAAMAQQFIPKEVSTLISF